MAGGPILGEEGLNKRYPGRTTPFVFLTCLVAATGGALFGFDLGVTGGIVSMPGFLEQFFPGVLEEVDRDNTPGDTSRERFCQYNNQGLQWFTSSMFIAGAAACLPAGWITRKYGRKFAMLVAGLLFTAGVALSTAAWSLWVLILGRVLLGLGNSFGTIAVTLYNSEMAPAHIRGRLNQLFQLILSLGALVGQAINIGTTRIYPWGWRLSMGCAAVPSIILTLGGVLLPDTPNSLLQRGKDEAARAVLIKVRGTADVEEEFGDIRAAVQQAEQVKNPYRTICKRAYRPQLLIPLSVQIFHQWSGINTVTFFSPELLVSLGMPQKTALIATLLNTIASHLSTYVAIIVADKFGRRPLFIIGAIQEAVALVLIAVLIATLGEKLWTAWVVAIILCFYTGSFNASWAPLTWLYSSEIQPLETRAAGQSLSTLWWMILAFVVGQTYLTMLCALEWGLYLFFAGACILAAVTTYFLYPETKGLGIEETPQVFQQHWFWGRYSRDPEAARHHDTQLMQLPRMSLQSQTSMGPLHPNQSQKHGVQILEVAPSMEPVSEDAQADGASKPSRQARRSQEASRSRSRALTWQGSESLPDGLPLQQGSTRQRSSPRTALNTRQQPASDDPFWMDN
ncbi:hypothetical protein WJX73_007732 [Symbiochloris irregularis]|uniref:Major facilitator superfamily (MFS) profile domain-containing protein n=1 Tax=Symbiochloris irregularis TaxID=706552 RepID=A0AAW1PMZ6_9CHLO